MTTSLTRRTLLATTAAAGAGMLLPGGADAAIRGGPSSVPYWDRVLILIELDGGNDGLNTVIPFNIAEYNDRRPTLKYTSTELAATSLGNGPYLTNKVGVSATQAFALNPGMTHLKKGWNPTTPATHDLAVVLGVGYSNPNLSHFRSSDIWHGGSDWNGFPIDNWLGRLFVANAAGTPSSLTAHGVLLSRYSANPLKAAGVRYLAMSKPKEFADRSYYLPDTIGLTAPSPQFQHLLTTQHQVFQAASEFRAALMTKKASVVTATRPEHYDYTPPTFSSPDITFNPASSFEMRCKSIAEMIATAANAPGKRLQIPVYKVQIGGFDNHAGQKLKHADLLAQVSSAMASLRAAMIEKGLWDRVLIMTYSEFGRRVEENGSQGTDHGSASCHFLMGGGVNGGFYGQQSGLSNVSGQKDLDSRGNLVANVDYRQLYRTAAAWLGLTVPGADPLATYSPLSGCLA
jgi:uncharacterized protein (DUF1501 family)